MGCSGCGKEKIFARGLCQGCYWRLRRRGTVERINVVNSGRCSIAGCGREALAKNLCQKHYAADRHPLRQMWQRLRSRWPGQYPQAWDRFDGFLADIPLRPDVSHRAHRLDETKPFSKENFEWRAPMGSGRNQSMSKEEHAAYAREWHAQNKYGIPKGGLAKMVEDQGGVCAICHRPETQIDRRSGKLKSLHVDHDHETGKTRALLCSSCNSVIGHAGDSVEILRAAIAYLEKHSAP